MHEISSTQKLNPSPTFAESVGTMTFEVAASDMVPLESANFRLKYISYLNDDKNFSKRFRSI